MTIKEILEMTKHRLRPAEWLRLRVALEPDGSEICDDCEFSSMRPGDPPESYAGPTPDEWECTNRKNEEAWETKNCESCGRPYITCEGYSGPGKNAIYLLEK